MGGNHESLTEFDDCDVGKLGIWEIIWLKIGNENAQEERSSIRRVMKKR